MSKTFEDAFKELEEEAEAETTVAAEFDPVDPLFREAAHYIQKCVNIFPPEQESMRRTAAHLVKRMKKQMLEQRARTEKSLKG